MGVAATRRKPRLHKLFKLIHKSKHVVRGGNNQDRSEIPAMPRRQIINSPARKLGLNNNNNNNQSQMPTEIIVGVLALQGAFHEHLLLLHQASTRLRQRNDTEVKWQFTQVRNRQQLEACDALIIPGGESTTVSLVAARSGLLEPLREFVKYVGTFLPGDAMFWLRENCAWARVKGGPERNRLMILCELFWGGKEYITNPLGGHARG